MIDPSSIFLSYQLIAHFVLVANPCINMCCINLVVSGTLFMGVMRLRVQGKKLLCGSLKMLQNGRAASILGSMNETGRWDSQSICITYMIWSLVLGYLKVLTSVDFGGMMLSVKSFASKIRFLAMVIWIKPWSWYLSWHLVLLFLLSCFWDACVPCYIIVGFSSSYYTLTFWSAQKYAVKRVTGSKFD